VRLAGRVRLTGHTGRATAGVDTAPGLPARQPLDGAQLPEQTKSAAALATCTAVTPEPVTVARKAVPVLLKAQTAVQSPLKARTPRSPPIARH
jgi:hypothetical protein